MTSHATVGELTHARTTAASHSRSGSAPMPSESAPGARVGPPAKVGDDALSALLLRSVHRRALSAPMWVGQIPGPLLQRTRWVWNGHEWRADGPVNTPKPTFSGGVVGAVFRDEPVGPDPYAAAETLADGTVIDYPALVRVMDGVELGVTVKSGVWRAMRQALSDAITLSNKSHPAHGSNFDAPQRPETQIKDWANVISGPLKAKLQAFFAARYGVYL